WLRAELCVQRNNTRRRATSGLRGGVEQPLHDHAVAPLAVELGVAVIDADHAEAATLGRGEGGRGLREDPRDDLPEAARGVRAAERLQRRAPGAGTARGTGDVHGVLGHTGVGGPAAVRPGSGPRDDPAVTLDDHGGKLVSLVLQLRDQLL